MADSKQFADIQHFDNWSNSYDNFWGQRYLDRVQEAMLRTVSREVRHQPLSILDVGCGTGRLLRKAATLWPKANLVGVDPAKEWSRCRDGAPAARIEMAPVEYLPLPDYSVDLVLSTMSFHHWADQAAGMAEVARVLRSGRYFSLADISLPGWLARILPRATARSSALVRDHFQRVGISVKRQERMLARTILLSYGIKAR